MEHSFFDSIAQAPADMILQLTAAFMEDPRPNKVNLSVGLYRDETLHTPILKTVKAAEKYLLSQQITKEYLPIDGDHVYLEEIGRLIFGQSVWEQHRHRICGIQTPGGTAGLRIGGEFLQQAVRDEIAVPDPTWPNHLGIFKQCHYKVSLYPYYDLKQHRLNIEAMLEALKKTPPRSIVLFHACCHNPTGADLSEAEWNQVVNIIQEREILPFFDFAYQGLGKGLEEDAYAIRLFAQRSLEFAVASSYSKNFGLYSERVAALFVVSQNEETSRRILSQLKFFARTTYSNPPQHGAAIVTHILSNPELKHEWTCEVDMMRHRIENLRKQFVQGLQTQQNSQDFSYLLNRIGMFCFLGLEKEKVSKLREEYGIYMTADGRINLAGLSQRNLNYVIEAILALL